MALEIWPGKRSRLESAQHHGAASGTNSSGLRARGEDVSSVRRRQAAKSGDWDTPLKADGIYQFGPRFAGVIDEVRISNVARYKANFTPQSPFEPDADTLGLYHFDEGTGDVLKDSSGNHHDGKITGAKWVKADGSAATSTK